MPNRNYIKGVRKERVLVNHARADNHLAFRSAGSHSPIDVVIINHDNHLINLIQCKPSSMRESAKSKLLSSLSYLNGTYAVVVSVQ
jgi:Holliday junction resolvase